MIKRISILMLSVLMLLALGAGPAWAWIAAAASDSANSIQTNNAKLFYKGPGPLGEPPDGWYVNVAVKPEPGYKSTVPDSGSGLMLSVWTAWMAGRSDYVRISAPGLTITPVTPYVVSHCTHFNSPDTQPITSICHEWFTASQPAEPFNDTLRYTEQGGPSNEDGSCVMYWLTSPSKFTGNITVVFDGINGEKNYTVPVSLTGKPLFVSYTPTIAWDPITLRNWDDYLISGSVIFSSSGDFKLSNPGTRNFGKAPWQDISAVQSTVQYPALPTGQVSLTETDVSDWSRNLGVPSGSVIEDLSFQPDPSVTVQASMPAVGLILNPTGSSTLPVGGVAVGLAVAALLAVLPLLPIRPVSVAISLLPAGARQAKLFFDDKKNGPGKVTVDVVAGKDKLASGVTVTRGQSADVTLPELVGKVVLTVKTRRYRNVSRNKSVEFDPGAGDASDE